MSIAHSEALVSSIEDWISQDRNCVSGLRAASLLPVDCTQSDNDILVSQHFFALKLTKDDVLKVLTGLENASVVTDAANPQIVKNAGPI